MDYIPINFKLILNPVNWAIILLTLIIGGFAIHAFSPNKNS